MRVDANPPAEFGVRHFAVADGSFGGGQITIFEGIKDSSLCGGDAGVFQDVVCPVGKAIFRIVLIIGACHGNGRRINTGPLAKIPVRVAAVGGRVTMRVEFAGAEGGGDGLLLDGKASLGEKTIDPFGKAIWGKLDFVVGGLINLRGPTIGAVEFVADLLEGQFLLVPQA